MDIASSVRDCVRVLFGLRLVRVGGCSGWLVRGNLFGLVALELHPALVRTVLRLAAYLGLTLLALHLSPFNNTPLLVLKAGLWLYTCRDGSTYVEMGRCGLMQDFTFYLIVTSLSMLM